MAYMGFEKVEESAAEGGARNPAAVAASVGRKKYGKGKFQKAAAAGKKMKGMKPKKKAKKAKAKGAIGGMLMKRYNEGGY